MRRLLETLKDGGRGEEERRSRWKKIIANCRGDFLAGTTHGAARFTRQAIFEGLVRLEGGGVAFWCWLNVRGPHRCRSP